MALPVIDTPTFELEIPSSKKTLTFRPFLVKEEKLLTLASETNEMPEMVNACQQIVSNCSFGKLDAKELAMYDLQWLFLQLRAKSVSDKQAFTLICGHCKSNLPWEVDLNDFKIVGLDEATNNKIEISETMGLVLKHPSSTIMAKADSLDDADLITESIDYIYNEEEVFSPKEQTKEELKDFIESMPITSILQIKEFFEKTPIVENVIEFTCPKCEGKNVVSVNGYEHFFD